MVILKCLLCWAPGWAWDMSCPSHWLPPSWHWSLPWSCSSFLANPWWIIPDPLGRRWQPPLGYIYYMAQSCLPGWCLMGFLQASRWGCHWCSSSACMLMHTEQTTRIRFFIASLSFPTTNRPIGTLSTLAFLIALLIVKVLDMLWQLRQNRINDHKSSNDSIDDHGFFSLGHGHNAINKVTEAIPDTNQKIVEKDIQEKFDDAKQELDLNAENTISKKPKLVEITPIGSTENSTPFYTFSSTYLHFLINLCRNHQLFRKLQ